VREKKKKFYPQI
jgi:hypothetical protein